MSQEADVMRHGIVVIVLVRYIAHFLDKAFSLVDIFANYVDMLQIIINVEVTTDVLNVFSVLSIL